MALAKMLNRPVKTNRGPLQDAVEYKPLRPLQRVNQTCASRAEPVRIWIYLNDGARMRVEEVREVADGAWYNREKLQYFSPANESPASKGKCRTPQVKTGRTRLVVW